MARRAVILAGGLGRRLEPYTAILPKPLMPLFDDKAVVEHVLLGLSNSGIRDVTITLGYLGHLLEAVVGSGEKFGVSVTYTHETSPLGTAGPLTLLEGVDPHDEILVVNGDTYTDLDYASFADRVDPMAEAAIACVHRELRSEYGVVDFDDYGHLKSYREKPKFSMVVSTGIYLLRPSALELLSLGQRSDMPDLLRELQSRGRVVQCITGDWIWRDLGRAEDFSDLRARSGLG